MKKTFKKLFFLMVMTALCAVMTMTASAENVTGECGLEGDNLTWSLDTETGVLSIDGEGEMSDFDESPWAECRDDIYTVIISNGVTSIGESAFEECYRLEKVTIPETIKTIGDYAFLSCLSLEEVVLPKNLESIGREVFANLPFLEKITVESMNADIGELSLCVSEFTVHDISREDFVDLFSRYYNGTIGYEEIEKYLGYLDSYIFTGIIYCHPESTAEVYAIENDVAHSHTHFGEGEWEYDYWQMVRYRKCIYCDWNVSEPLPSFTEGYYTYTVKDNEAIITRVNTDISGDVIIPDTLGGYPVRAIGEQAFYECYKIISLTVSDNVKEIERNAFYDLYLLQHLDLGDGVEKTEEDFYKMWSLETVHIGKNLRELPEGSFVCCLSLEKFIVDEENPYFYADEAGVLYDKVNSVLFSYPEANKSTVYTVADGTVAIGQQAFSDIMYLETVVFPDTLKKIGEGAFSPSSGIKEIHIPSSVTTVDDFAFALSFSLEKVFFESDAEIGELIIGTDKELIRPATEVAELLKQSFVAKANGDEEKADELTSQFENSFSFTEEIIYNATIYCHDDDKTPGVEAYAKEYGMPFERYHTYEEEWTYEHDNYVRYKSCTYENCSAKLTEELEREEIGDVEIVGPADPDTDFVVDEIKPNEGDNFILIEETVNGKLGTEWELLKAFDINLKNHDGVHVQPNGTVKVKLPLDWSKNGNYKVYRVNEDGTLTDMNAYRQGSHMVFDTDHFSIYVIVEESVNIDNPSDEPAEEPEEEIGFIHKLFAFLTKILEFFRCLLSK